jgi:hypothetical protein
LRLVLLAGGVANGFINHFFHVSAISYRGLLLEGCYGISAAGPVEVVRFCGKTIAAGGRGPVGGVSRCQGRTVVGTTTAMHQRCAVGYGTKGECD